MTKIIQYENNPNKNIKNFIMDFFESIGWIIEKLLKLLKHIGSNLIVFIIIIASIWNTANINYIWLDSANAVAGVNSANLYWVLAGAIALMYEIIRGAFKEEFYKTHNTKWRNRVYVVTLFLIGYVILTNQTALTKATNQAEKSNRSKLINSEEYKNIDNSIAEIDKKITRLEKLNRILRSKSYKKIDLKIPKKRAKGKNEPWAEWVTYKKNYKLELKNYYDLKKASKLDKSKASKEIKTNKELINDSTQKKENLMKKKENLFFEVSQKTKDEGKNKARNFLIFSIILEMLALGGFYIKTFNIKPKQEKNNNAQLSMATDDNQSATDDNQSATNNNQSATNNNQYEIYLEQVGTHLQPITTNNNQSLTTYLFEENKICCQKKDGRKIYFSYLDLDVIFFYLLNKGKIVDKNEQLLSIAKTIKLMKNDNADKKKDQILAVSRFLLDNKITFKNSKYNYLNINI